MYVEIVGCGRKSAGNRAEKIGDTYADASWPWFPAVPTAKFPVAMWVSENKHQKKLVSDLQ